METRHFNATDGNDAGKVFIITKMSARAIEKWAARALLAMMHSGMDVPEDVNGSGIAGLLKMGLSGLMGIRWVDLEPLLDEMLDYVQIMPDPKTPHVLRRWIDDDFEDPRTLLKLRKAIWDINTAFLPADAFQKLKAPASQLQG